jgi:hypothetical protein
MNKTYEIEYHIEGFVPVQREVVTVDGRSMRQNRLPVCLIDYAQRTAQAYEAYRFRIHDYLPPHISGAGVKVGVARLAYEQVMTDVPQ